MPYRILRSSHGRIKCTSLFFFTFLSSMILVTFEPYEEIDLIFSSFHFIFRYAMRRFECFHISQCVTCFHKIACFDTTFFILSSTPFLWSSKYKWRRLVRHCWFEHPVTELLSFQLHSLKRKRKDWRSALNNQQISPRLLRIDLSWVLKFRSVKSSTGRKIHLIWLLSRPLPISFLHQTMDLAAMQKDMRSFCKVPCFKLNLSKQKENWFHGLLQYCNAYWANECSETGQICIFSPFCLQKCLMFQRPETDNMLTVDFSSAVMIFTKNYSLWTQVFFMIRVIPSFKASGCWILGHLITWYKTSWDFRQLIPSLLPSKSSWVHLAISTRKACQMPVSQTFIPAAQALLSTVVLLRFECLQKVF